LRRRRGGSALGLLIQQFMIKSNGMMGLPLKRRGLFFCLEFFHERRKTFRIRCVEAVFMTEIPKIPHPLPVEVSLGIRDFFRRKFRRKFSLITFSNICRKDYHFGAI
jgi:hypothetical protein